MLLIFFFPWQPNAVPYDDSFEKLDLDSEGWKSKCPFGCLGLCVIMSLCCCRPPLLPSSGLIWEEIRGFVPDPSLYTQGL